MENWEQGEQHQEVWDSFPKFQAPVMQHAAHPVTAEVPPGYDVGSSTPTPLRSGDFSKVEAKKKGPVGQS